VQFNVRIDEDLKGAVERRCNVSGETIAFFVQEALIDRLEELEDIEDLKAIRHEPTRPFAEAVAELGLDDSE
jgi:predicted DNA-binding protein